VILTYAGGAIVRRIEAVVTGASVTSDDVGAICVGVARVLFLRALVYVFKPNETSVVSKNETNYAKR